MIFKSQYCFANISATEAQIFMKFKAYLYKIVKNHQIIFRKDPCTDARTRGVNARRCEEERTESEWADAWLLNFKFHKDPSFSCGDICKTILTFKNHQFSMYFPYFHCYAPQKSSKMDNY